MRVKKLHPALKHAGYSVTSILPGENAAEYEKLRRNLIAEYSPNGVLETGMVENMARIHWRMQNIDTFQIAEAVRAYWSKILNENNPDAGVEFLIGNFDPVERETARRGAEYRIRTELGEEIYELVKMGEIATIDRLMKDLEVLDRLGAMFDKYLKRLLMLKGLKSISSEPSAAPQKRLPGPSKAA
jgi:hypothetical protein